MANTPSLRLLSALPVPDTTWEPIEPKVQPQHHPRGILRNVSGVHAIVTVNPLSAAERTGTDKQ
ncbi:MAG: hypothetical protein HYV09_19800 [Deltaproteobacteria bacterium]|nr:hypothetical protein [Deltaproteobacteria bacterium]